ncbi:M15 family metallopeptidase [Cytobacillus sp. FSL R5-0569]|uniref:M15 family metallopeptidase n=1 Tax=Cytobacillus sp. FSL R5-0569 TaxID=2921649 RepID=UPI0030F79985
MGLIYKERNLNNIAKLADNTKAKAIQWHEYLEKDNINILIYETIRSEAKQRENVNKGTSQTMRSYHLVGQALDFVPVNAKGETLWNGYGAADVKKALKEAKRLGFEWGGDWKSFIDKPHLQYNYEGYGTDTFGKKVDSKPSKSKPKANLTVDGKWGNSTTKALQKALGTPIDGIISDQTRNSVTTAFYGTTIDFGNGKKGSTMVKALQKKVGSKADGLLGKNTIKALQKHLGTVQDGSLSRPSVVVKELQRGLNKGSF